MLAQIRVLTHVLRTTSPKVKASSWDKQVAHVMKKWKNRKGRPQAHLPKTSLSSRFSVEGLYAGGYTPIGTHCPWIVLEFNPLARLEALVQRCPEIHLLQNMSRTKTSGHFLEGFAAVLDRTSPPSAPYNISWTG